MARDRHPKKEIEDALRFAEARGWRVEQSSGHAWGRILCSQGDRYGCTKSIWSTPRSPGNHAKRIRRFVEKCPHVGEDANAHR